MSPKHSNSTTTINIIKDIDAQFHQQFVFFDASDSFDSDNCLIQSNKFSKKFNNNNKLKTKLTSITVHTSTITSVGQDDVINATDSSVSVPSSSFISLLAKLVIKMMWVQFTLLFCSVKVPIWFIYYSCMFIIDPFRSMNAVKCYVMRKVLSFFSFFTSCVRWVMHDWIRKHESMFRLCFRVVWGSLWAVYVGVVLCGLLVFAFVVSGVVLKGMIEEPVRISRQLSLDYTKDSPTAFVPLMCCPESVLDSGGPVLSGCGLGLRVVPVGHKVRGAVLLTLPESDYNRNLGNFQVRVDFLSCDGKHLFSTRQPSMLRYKSQPIRLLLTFLKLAPLITGYSSESQTLNMKFSGYTEGNVPTSCLRVILEQRAEFTLGTGVPVIYAASLKLESEPPFLKRILWSWKWTIYIWSAIMIFVVELLFTVVCCTPVIVPRLQRRRV